MHSWLCLLCWLCSLYTIVSHVERCAQTHDMWWWIALTTRTNFVRRLCCMQSTICNSNKIGMRRNLNRKYWKCQKIANSNTLWISHMKSNWQKKHMKSNWIGKLWMYTFICDVHVQPSSPLPLKFTRTHTHTHTRTDRSRHKRAPKKDTHQREHKLTVYWIEFVSRSSVRANGAGEQTYALNWCWLRVQFVVRITHICAHTIKRAGAASWIRRRRRLHIHPIHGCIHMMHTWNDVHSICVHVVVFFFNGTHNCLRVPHVESDSMWCD